MNNKKQLTSPFNRLITSGAFQENVMSDQGRRDLYAHFLELSREGRDEAMASMLLAVQALQAGLVETKEKLIAAENTNWTGLPNKKEINIEVEKNIVHAKREAEGEQKSPDRVFAYCDLDNLKALNKISLGAGDAAIQAVADRLAQIVRSDDALAHISGDEFLIVATNRSGKQPFLEKLLGRYQQELGGLCCEYDGYIYPVNVSMGAVLMNPDFFVEENQNLDGELGYTARKILDEANKRLLDVKNGKNISRHAAAPRAVGQVCPGGKIFFYPVSGVNLENYCLLNFS